MLYNIIIKKEDRTEKIRKRGQFGEEKKQKRKWFGSDANRLKIS